MKKWLVLILTLVAVFSFISCDKEPVGDPTSVNGQDYFNASVTQVNDTFILAEVTENISGALAVGTEVSVSRNNISSEEFPELVVGDYIRVVYAGEVLEKDPPEFQQIISVFKLNEEGAVLENADGESVNLPDAGDEGFPNWGLTLSVKDVTESGLTLVCTQSGGEPAGELQTGSDYKLIVLKEAWEDVPTIIEDYGWDMIAYMVSKDDVTEFEYNWEWLYGKLPAGTYRMVKGFTEFRETGDYDNFDYWIEFEIK